MADKDDDTISISVDDLNTVQVVVDEDQLDEPKVEAKAKERTRTKRVSPDSDTPEDALAQAQAFGKQQEEARKAAEATALAERQRADNAERARLQAIKEAEEHQERANNSELTLIESRIASAQSELTALQDSYTHAAESGEFKQMGEIQVKLSRAAAALDRFEALKSELEANPKTVTTTEGRVTAEPQISVSEKALQGYAPAAQNWLRQHMDCLPPEVGGNATRNSLMMAGHFAAKAKGLAEGSDAYFKEIENHLDQETHPTIVQQQAMPTTQARTAPPPAAPVSRDAPQANGQPQARSVREVRLTKEQQEIARMSFGGPNVTDQQAYGMYARNLLELEAEGKLGRTTH